MTTKRQAIIEYLYRKPYSTASEISHALHTTLQNIRHHLSILIEQGVVEVASQEAARKRGRPALYYSLASHIHEHNLDGLVHSLLGEYIQQSPDELTQGRLERIAKRLAQPDESGNFTLMHRLYRAVQRLNEMHYQARWEARTRAPHFILGHCPYLSILPEHPELCLIDRYLLESLLEVPTEQIDKLARDSRGATYCMFLVKER